MNMRTTLANSFQTDTMGALYAFWGPHPLQGWRSSYHDLNSLIAPLSNVDELHGLIGKALNKKPLDPPTLKGGPFATIPTQWSSLMTCALKQQGQQNNIFHCGKGPLKIV